MSRRTLRPGLRFGQASFSNKLVVKAPGWPGLRYSEAPALRGRRGFGVPQPRPPRSRVPTKKFTSERDFIQVMAGVNALGGAKADAAARAHGQFPAVDDELVQGPLPVPRAGVHQAHDMQVLQ